MAKAEEAEILVVGAGMVGLTFATALADAGLAVMVIDHMDPAAFRDEAFDGRSSAIARGSRQALEVLGLWDGMAPAAAPILDIRISDGQPYEGRFGGPLRRGSASALHLPFSCEDFAESQREGRPAPQPLGHIVENTAVRRACLDRARALK